MAKVAKIIEKMKAAPNGIDFREAVKVLEAHGYKHLKPNGGCHHNFRNDAGDVITIKKSNPLKAAYVKDVLSRIGV
ncbi:type II toxin-antitoxin system HicA family toxin [Paenibacillus pasadenensis]|uniref:type II toxin-antitoxin system HicA family toxin n=1 Tax=Paenibacillus pasadenensis TaxID=217090 RepID=UPI00203EF3CC|nr:type II toxin-antitoxin system HicA family toxin [Paenibacillus pasadenensis]MCM3746178.1 type II toxin-antitoxin system HicA family toxin [Paenibacillus pasadenensis]